MRVVSRWCLVRVTLIISVAGGCTSAPPEPRLGLRIVPCGEAPTDIALLPPDTWAAQALRRTPLVHDAVQKVLRDASASPIWCGDAEDVIYRVVSMPSSRPPELVALVREEAGWSVEVTEFADPRNVSSADPLTRIVARRTYRRPISEDVALRTIDALGAAGFWRTLEFEDAGTEDGTIWVVEGREHGAYRFIVRLNSRDAVSKAAEALLRLVDDGGPT